MSGTPVTVPLVTSGVAILPNTGGNKVLFAIGAGLLLAGIVVFAVSFVLGRKNVAAN